MFESKENQIREERTRLAMSKGLLGSAGKLAAISAVYGTPIIHQDAGNASRIGPSGYGLSVTRNYFTGYEYEEYNNDELPTMHEDTVTRKIGNHFSGMRFGLRMEITWNDDTAELKCVYKGRVVYKEQAGELEAYIPFDEWEEIVDDLYAKAVKINKKDKVDSTEVKEKVFNNKKKEFLDEMKAKWGDLNFK